MIWIIVSIIISMIYWIICRCFTYYYDREWRSFKMMHFILGVLLSIIPILNIAAFIFISLALFYFILCGDVRLKKMDNFFIRFLNKEL